MRVLFSALLLAGYQLVFSQIPKQSDIVGVYNFNSNVDDESGKNYNGILGGSPSLTTDRFGNSNSAYLLDGVDDFIYFGNESLSEFTTNSNGGINESFSISVWAKSTNPNESSFLALGESLGLYTGMITDKDIILKTLNENGDIHRPYGRNSVGILIFQDLAVIPIFLK